MSLRAAFLWIKHRFALVFVLGLLFLGILYYLYLNRQPFTQNAFIVTNVRPVTALVDGYITDLHVYNNQFVRAGEKIMTIYAPPYALDVANLQHALAAEEAAQNALSYQIRATESLVRERVYAVQNAQYLAEQALKLFHEQGVMSQQQAEVAYRNWQIALEQLTQARFNLNQLWGEFDVSSAKQNALSAQIARAKLFEQQTEVCALSDGVINNLYLSPGTYVEAGTVLFAIVNTDNYWVQANFEETVLSEVRQGQRAHVYLWQYPGVVFEGVVDTVNWAVNRQISGENGMQNVVKENEWFLLPQRFPVMIRLINPDPAYPLHPGASAYVRIDTPSRLFRQFFWLFFQM